ncbi:MAG: UbiA family prenyltransferase [Burkholderiaceae bacterium]
MNGDASTKDGDAPGFELAPTSSGASGPVRAASALAEEPTLFVSLDRTLIRSELLWESFAAALRRAPLLAGRALFSLFWGRAALKRALGRIGPIDPQALPYRRWFVDWLRAQYFQGRRLVLCTAADRPHAEAVAKHLGIFDEVLASDGTYYNRGDSKLDGIRGLCAGQAFDYCGDSLGDLPVMRAARRAYLVKPAAAIVTATRPLANVGPVPDAGILQAQDVDEQRWRHWVAALRPLHWLKNLLVLVPFFSSFLLTDIGALLRALLAAIAMSLAASAGYLVNDLLDMQADRRHPRKRLRPFAAARLTAAEGFGGAALLLLISMSIASFSGGLVWLWVAVYLIGTLAYSVFFRREPIVDVTLLAGLYTIRIIVGAEAVGVVLSFWLLAFSMFFFFGLALMKRCGELVVRRERGEQTDSGRGYQPDDLAMLVPTGIAAGSAAVLLLALYVQSPTVIERYSSPQALWFALIALLLWQSRAWLDTVRGRMHDDPLIYAIREPLGRVLLLIVIASFSLASLWTVAF